MATKAFKLIELVDQITNRSGYYLAIPAVDGNWKYAPGDFGFGSILWGRGYVGRSRYNRIRAGYLLTGQWKT